MNTTGIPKSLHPQLPHICQHHTTTGVLLILRASHTCKHNFYTRTATESTRKLSAQQGRSDHIWGAVRSFAPCNQELNKKQLSRAQNSPQFQPQDPLVKANKLPKNLGGKRNFHRTSPGRLDLLPRAVRPPIPSMKLLHVKICKRAQNEPLFHQYTPLIKVNKLIEENPGKTKLLAGEP
jgi:hypothetical protein